MAEPRKCVDCICYHKSGLMAKGECRNSPPASHLVPVMTRIAGQAAYQFTACFPTVNDDWWCRQFLSREDAELLDRHRSEAVEAISRAQTKMSEKPKKRSMWDAPAAAPLPTNESPLSVKASQPIPPSGTGEQK